MAKQKGIVPFAFISSQLNKAEMTAVSSRTMMQIYEYSDKEETIVDFDEAFPISCVKALFKEFQLPVYNNLIFAVSHMSPPRITWLKLHDESAVIILLDSSKKVSEAKAYLKVAQGIRKEQLQFSAYVRSAKILASSRTMTMRLTDKRLPRDLLIDLDKVNQRYELLLADLKANFRLNLCA